jgi:hypothetical protein
MASPCDWHARQVAPTVPEDTGYGVMNACTCPSRLFGVKNVVLSDLLTARFTSPQFYQLNPGIGMAVKQGDNIWWVGG